MVLVDDFMLAERHHKIFLECSHSNRPFFRQCPRKMPEIRAISTSLPKLANASLVIREPAL